MSIFCSKDRGTILEENFLKKSITHNNFWQKKVTEVVNSLGLEAKTYANFVLIKIDKKIL